MTEPRLPQAEFLELPAPPDGEAVAVRAGRGIRRRRRRMVGTGAAALSMALVAGVAVAAGTGSDHASDQLIPAVPGRHVSASPSPGPTHAATVAAGRPAATQLTSATNGTTGAGAAPAAATGTSQAGSQGGDTRQQSSTGYRTPPLRRTYRTAPPPSAPSTQQGPSGRICSASYDDSKGGAITTDWCVRSVVTRTSHGHDLAIEICRDTTGPSQLSFSRQVEVDLAVMSGKKTLWRWSTGQPDAADPHALNAAADACWTWTAPWTDVNATGHRLPSGSYTLAATSVADELRALGPQTTAFSIS